MQPAVLAAVITSAASIVVAVTSAALAYTSQRRMQSEKAKQDSKLEELKDKLSDLAAERSARRSYEYDARKRLYAVTEPLLFQLSERAEALQASIRGLARTARSGDLDLGRNWLSLDRYYLSSTVHRLLAPLALYHLLQNGLTQLDLGLDASTRTQYMISKYLAWTLTDHHEFAALEPRIPYSGNMVATSSGAQVPLQGLPSGIIDTAGDSLIVRSSDEPDRVMRFGEFDDAFTNQKSQLYKACDPVAQLLYDFHPRTHPVLWRILVTQAHLCASCIGTRDLASVSEQQTENLAVRPWLSIPPNDLSDYDWRQPGDTTADSHVLVEPFAVAKQYLEERLHSEK